MLYKVHFENNVPVGAVAIPRTAVIDRAEFGEEDGKMAIKHFCVEADTEADAIKQAKEIIETIFRF
jgi:hypothetical protein